MKKRDTKHPIKGRRKSELLMPAGSLEKLKFAVLYGADAVYMGTPDMSLRVKSAFTLEEVIEGISFAHKHGVRVYLTLNLFAHNKDVPKLDEYIKTVRMAKPDGLIIADPGVFEYVKEHAPELELHVSTQANVTSYLGVQYWERQGAKLVVMAREVTYEELTEIRERCPEIKLEAFVHGSMCMTYSGRCLLSNFMTERGANQGSCTNSCRWNYKLHLRLKDGTTQDLEINEHNKDMFEFLLEEKFRPGEFMPLEEDMRGSYILNSKDLCLMPRLDDYLSIGVDSLKVEGRGKSPYYAGIVARSYRMAIDDYYKDPENWHPRPYMEELETTGNRGFTLAFHEGRLRNYAHNYEDTQTLAEWEFAGIVRAVEDDYFLVEIKNKWRAGDVLEFIPHRHKEIVRVRLYHFEDAKTGKVEEDANVVPGKHVKVPFSAFDREDMSSLKERIKPYTIIRKESALTEAEWERLKLDAMTQKIEIGDMSEALYQKKLKKLQEEVDAEVMTRRPKTPRFGVEGCCAKGCNGCLVFWNDQKYQKARDLLQKKKQGEMFGKKESKAIRSEALMEDK